MYTPRHPVRSIVIMASALLALFLLSFVVGRYGVPLCQKCTKARFAAEQANPPEGTV